MCISYSTLVKTATSRLEVMQNKRDATHTYYMYFVYLAESHAPWKVPADSECPYGVATHVCKHMCIHRSNISTLRRDDAVICDDIPRLTSGKLRV